MVLWMVIGLLIEYVIIGIVAVAVGKWGLALYFAGSAILTAGVIWMNGKGV